MINFLIYITKYLFDFFKSREILLFLIIEFCGKFFNFFATVHKISQKMVEPK